MADHTATVRRRCPRMVCAVAAVEMATGSRRCNRRTSAGGRPSASRTRGRRSGRRRGCCARSARRAPGRSCSRRRQAPVGRDVEPVDFAAQPHAVHHGLDAELDRHRRAPRRDPPARSNCRRAPWHRPGTRPLRRRATQLRELLVALQLVPGPFELGIGGVARGAPGGWCQKRPSNAACTSVPLTAGGDGGSGRCSIWENPNAIAQLVKAATLEGVRVRGRSSAMTRGYGGVQTGTGMLRRR